MSPLVVDLLRKKYVNLCKNLAAVAFCESKSLRLVSPESFLRIMREVSVMFVQP